MPLFGQASDGDMQLAAIRLTVILHNYPERHHNILKPQPGLLL